jgi:hypothetical protein
VVDRLLAEHHDASVRTTLTLDPDVARLLDEEVHRQRRPLKQVVNDALRRGLAPQPGPARRRRFRVRAHATRLRPGIDITSLNRLVDELEDDAVIAKMAKQP